LIYSATITSASLRLRESRIIADLLIQGLSRENWKEALLEQNVLQMSSIESAKRISSLLRARLEPLGTDLWQIVRDGEKEQATQAVLSGAIKNSRLLGDFMDSTLRDQRALFAKKLEYPMWSDYIASCRGRDPDMPSWSETTLAKLRSAVFSILAEAGYIKDTRSLLLQNVFVDAHVADCLRSRGETYVLRCLEVAE